jgi:hypothetical protein
MAAVGAFVLAADFPASVVDSQNATGTTTSTTFTATLSGGLACGVTFTAPTSGKIVVHNYSLIQNSGANDTACGWVLRTGSTVGAGTVVTAASDIRSLRHKLTTQVLFGAAHMVTGLTAGAVYNVQQAFRCDAGTGTFAAKELSVVPVP